jgi:hypothetical protein
VPFVEDTRVRASFVLDVENEEITMQYQLAMTATSYIWVTRFVSAIFLNPHIIPSRNHVSIYHKARSCAIGLVGSDLKDTFCSDNL